MDASSSLQALPRRQAASRYPSRTERTATCPQHRAPPILLQAIHWAVSILRRKGRQTSRKWCMNDGIDPTPISPRTIWGISWKKTQYLTWVRSHHQNTSTILSSPKAATLEFVLWKKPSWWRIILNAQGACRRSQAALMNIYAHTVSKKSLISTKRKITRRKRSSLQPTFLTGSLIWWAQKTSASIRLSTCQPFRFWCLRNLNNRFHPVSPEWSTCWRPKKKRTWQSNH